MRSLPSDVRVCFSGFAVAEATAEKNASKNSKASFFMAGSVNLLRLRTLLLVSTAHAPRPEHPFHGKAHQPQRAHNDAGNDPCKPDPVRIAHSVLDVGRNIAYGEARPNHAQ